MVKAHPEGSSRRTKPWYIRLILGFGSSGMHCWENVWVGKAACSAFARPCFLGSSWSFYPHLPPIQAHLVSCSKPLGTATILPSSGANPSPFTCFMTFPFEHFSCKFLGNLAAFAMPDEPDDRIYYVVPRIVGRLHVVRIHVATKVLHPERRFTNYWDAHACMLKLNAMRAQ